MTDYRLCLRCGYGGSRRGAGGRCPRCGENLWTVGDRL